MAWLRCRRDTMTDTPIQFSIIDSIAHCLLTNPPKNEINKEFFRCLTQLHKEVFPSLDVRGLIIYGKGRHFSSGANLEELQQIYRSLPDDKPAAFLNENMNTFQAIASLPFPVVAAINGCCLGAGLELALACHFRICSPHAVFGLPETTFGLIPGCGGTVRLPRVLPRAKAIELILSGKTVPADEALSCGLIDHCVKKDLVLATAIKLITLHSTAPH